MQQEGESGDRMISGCKGYRSGCTSYIMESVREAQAAGELTTREEALSYIGSLLTSTPGRFPLEREKEEIEEEG